MITFQYFTAQCRGGIAPSPPENACSGLLEKREKIERKGESQAKIGKIRLKIGKKGKIEKNIKVR